MSPLATWTGPYTAILPNGIALNPGDQHDVSDADLQSGHWEPVKPEPILSPARTNITPAEEGTD